MVIPVEHSPGSHLHLESLLPTPFLNSPLALSTEPCGRPPFFFIFKPVGFCVIQHSYFLKHRVISQGIPIDRLKMFAHISFH